MKTNFLYFKEQGYISYTATAAQTDFAVKGGTIVPNNFAIAVADTAAVRADFKVSITSAAANTGNRGSDYANANTTAGEVTVLEIEALSLGGDNLAIATVVGNAQEGYSIKAGDIVTIETIPDEGTEACFRADRLLGVFRNGSDTSTSIHFKASNGTDADDYIVLTHPDNDGAEFKLIANYINEACNANFNKRGDIITVWDKQNNIVGRGLNDAGVTNMVIIIA
jgi:hypothetical protein